MSTTSDKNKQEAAPDLSAVVKFDAGEFEQRLAEVRQDFNDELKQSVLYKEPSFGEVPLNFNIPEAKTATPAPRQEPVPAAAPPLSGLLASLAQEAQQSIQSKQSLEQSKLADSLRVHEALERVRKFLLPFIQHVNAVEPAIKRSYRLDARSVFGDLKWQGALVDSRKQGMSDTSLLSHVAFSVNFVAPQPVLLKRPWGQFEAVKKELQHLKLKPLDDLEAIYKNPQQEWLETRLDPALPVQIVFQGSYELGMVEVMTRNLADFGQTAFRLQPEVLSQAVLDELGLFLLGRVEQLPPLLRAVAK